ncbi:UNVERIFIED_ORG: hypothetical protein FHR68_003037 [Xanthomonas campestris]
MRDVSKDELYREVGRTLELAQHLETNVVVYVTSLKALEGAQYKEPAFAEWLFKEMEEQKKTLGPLVKEGVKALKEKGVDWSHVEAVFDEAVAARNHLAHSFFRKHGPRFNDASGRGEMLAHIAELQLKIQRARKVAEDIATLTAAKVILLRRDSATS